MPVRSRIPAVRGISRAAPRRPGAPGGPGVSGLVVVAIARVVNTLVSAAGVVVTVTSPALSVLMLATVSSSPCGAAAAGLATSTWPTLRRVTWAGAVAGQTKTLPLPVDAGVSDPSLDIVAADSTFVCDET